MLKVPPPKPFSPNDDRLGGLHGSDSGTGGMGRKRRLAMHVRLQDRASGGWRAVESERLSFSYASEPVGYKARARRPSC